MELRNSIPCLFFMQGSDISILLIPINRIAKKKEYSLEKYHNFCS